MGTMMGAAEQIISQPSVFFVLTAEVLESLHALQISGVVFS